MLKLYYCLGICIVDTKNNRYYRISGYTMPNALADNDAEYTKRITKTTLKAVERSRFEYNRKCYHTILDHAYNKQEENGWSAYFIGEFATYRHLKAFVESVSAAQLDFDRIAKHTRDNGIQRQIDVVEGHRSFIGDERAGRETAELHRLEQFMQSVDYGYKIQVIDGVEYIMVGA